MKERHHHANHVIDLELVDIGDGCYRWVFFIDGDYPTASAVASPCLASARDEAIQVAHLQIALMNIGIELAHGSRVGSSLH